MAQNSPERTREHIAFEVPQERDLKRIAAESVDIPVPRVMEEFHQERDQERITAQSVNVLVPRIMQAFFTL